MMLFKRNVRHVTTLCPLLAVYIIETVQKRLRVRVYLSLYLVAKEIIILTRRKNWPKEKKCLQPEGHGESVTLTRKSGPRERGPCKTISVAKLPQ